MIVASPLQADHAIRRDTVLAGDYYMHTVKAGQTLRILDIEGNQAADTLFYNAHDPNYRRGFENNRRYLCQHSHHSSQTEGAQL